MVIDLVRIDLMTPSRVHVRVKELSHGRCNVWHVNNACTSVMARLWTYTTSSGEEKSCNAFGVWGAV